MLRSHLSPSDAGGSVLRNTHRLALSAFAALFLSAGCSEDNLAPTGPEPYLDEIGHTDGRDERDGDSIGLRRRPPNLSDAAAAHPGISLSAAGATQISGIGYYAEPGQCEDPEGLGSDYALSLTGDLEGCVYVFVETAACSAGGAYNETGTETFVGLYNGATGTFRTTYRFTATYRDCANMTGQIAGRCQHPLIAGSGDGIFEGVTGRIDMRDDIEAGNFPYRGHFLSQGS